MKLLLVLIVFLFPVNIYADTFPKTVSVEKYVQYLSQNFPPKICAPSGGIVSKCYDGISYQSCLAEVTQNTKECFEGVEPKFEDFVCSSSDDCIMQQKTFRHKLVTCVTHRFEVKNKSKYNEKRCTGPKGKQTELKKE